MHDIPGRRTIRHHRAVRPPARGRGGPGPGPNPVRQPECQQEYRTSALAWQDAFAEYSTDGRQALRGSGRPAAAEPADLLGGVGRVCAVRLSQLCSDSTDRTRDEHRVPVLDAVLAPAYADRSRVQGGGDVGAEHDHDAADARRRDSRLLYQGVRPTDCRAPEYF